MQPSHVPTAEIVAFIQPYLPAIPARLLEVGCGEGHLAWQLDQLGYTVIAVDSSAQAVHQVEQLGLAAHLAQWPNFDTAPVDAVLFTRSLHHIHPLAEAVQRAAQLLKPAGLIVVDEFAFYEATPATVEWLYGLICTLESGHQLYFREEGLIKKLLNGGGDYSLWQRDHGHDLHSVVAMWAELNRYFEPIADTRTAYLYRYLCPLLAQDERGYALAARIFELENRAAQRGMITLIGRRFVGKLK